MTFRIGAFCEDYGCLVDVTVSVERADLTEISMHQHKKVKSREAALKEHTHNKNVGKI